MANSILDGVMAMVTPEMKQALASRLGESSQGIETGLGTAAAATLGGLASKVGDTNFLSQIVNMVSGSSGQNILGSLSSLGTSGPSGAVGDLVNRFLPMVFGGNQGQVTNLLTQKAGISAASASGLLKTAIPLILGYFAKLHASGSLNLGSLSSLLTAEAPNLSRFIPAGFLSGGAATVSSTARAAVAPVEPSGVGKAAGWLVGLGILGALLLAGVVYWALDANKLNVEPQNNAVKPTATAAVDTASEDVQKAWAALGAPSPVKLPDGTELNAPRLGVENRLLQFIQDVHQDVKKDVWFDFDRLLFETGKATLEPASDDQLHNVAAILKAYPKVNIKIGGYTDNTGDKAANQKLSEERAQNVKAELEKLGVEPSRLTAQGYGEDHPVADNSTEEGRQKNRRISMRVTAK
jgi:outer membrane protein OmpA-like peptidoglycan-associated protein